jgi:hypothetical protein
VGACSSIARSMVRTRGLNRFGPTTSARFKSTSALLTGRSSALEPKGARAASRPRDGAWTGRGSSVT